MAKKQLKKLNQPKKYLQGGSNMGSVAMMRQNPYYLGQVEKNAADQKLDATRQQAMNMQQTAVQAKKDSEVQQQAELNQSISNGTANLGQAILADKKAGVLGKFMLPAATTSSGIVAPTLQSSIAANSANAVANTGVSTVTGIGGAPITSSIGTSAPGAINIGTTGIGGAPIVSNTATNVGTTVAEGAGASSGGLMAANMSSLGAAGIGIAATVGGQVIKKRANDNSAYTFTDKERIGNTGGSMLSSAGTGFSTGAMLGSIVPGVGNVVGGLIGAGIGAGIGAIKANSENKQAEKEAARLQRNQSQVRGAFQSAYINSRLTSADTGFGLNSSTNMNNKFTNEYQVARTGGVTGIQEDRRTKKVPGGKIVPIEGTDAVEFIGRSHEKGGVTIDKNTEVEGGETMDQVAMNNNTKQDYIFSKYLKLGGKSFAQRHKEILKGSGSQADIQQLAAMQEKMAGRNSETVAVAKYGGIPQYAKGGVPEKNCPDGTFFNAYTGTCEPFSFTSMTNMVTNKETPALPDNNTTAGNWKKIAAEYISKKEGFTNKAKWDENAYRAGYGSDKVLRDGKLIPVTKGMTVTKEEALATLEAYSIDKYSNQIAKDLGEENWNKLNNNQRAALTSLGYNAGAAFISKRGYGRKIKYYIEAGNLDAAGDVIYSQGPKSGARSGYLPGLEKRRKEESNLFNSTQTQPTNQTSTQPVKKPEPVKKTLLPPPPVTSKVASLAERNNLPGIGNMQMNEEIQMPEYPKSNITFDPTVTKQERLEKENKAAGTFTDPTVKRPDGIQLFQDPKTKEYIYRDGNGNEIIRGKDRNKLENQLAALQPGFNGFDTILAEAEAPVRRRDLTGVKPNVVATTPTNAQVAADAQTVIAQQNGTANAPAVTANYNAPAGVQPAGSPPPPAASATNGGPGGTAPTINNQNTAFQHTAQGAGYLDYSDPNVAGGIWSGKRYDTEWRPLVASTMADPAKADQVINYLTNYTGTDAADVKAKLKGKNRDQQIAAIADLATDTKVGPFHNAVYGAIQSTGTPPVTPPSVVPPVVPPVTTTPPGNTTTTKRYTPCPPGTYLSTDGTCKQTPEYSKSYNPNLAAGVAAVAQLIPPIVGIVKPYERVGNIPGAPSVKGALLGRENLNQERATSREMNTAINQEVTNNNTGAAGFAIRQAAANSANKQMLDIANAENRANTELRGKEAMLGMEASKFNAENSMKGQMFNAEMQQRQNQYVDERRLGIADALAGRTAGIVNDYNTYKANDHLARVTNANTHSLERDKMYESLLKDSQNKNSQFNGASDAELRRIAAGLVEEQMGGVGRTGGVRQYISRLGELKSARATKAKL
jgi:GH24 family phage-related lysozyme (muramidase)